jgi:lipopolysaccharide transport system ATP-binding protein
MPIVEVNHVTKEFRLGQLHGIRSRLQRMAARIKGNSLPKLPEFKALDDVDFSVEEGEVLGIIGGNGAGKSTLLKLLSRITVPSAGTVHVRGKVAPLIEVGAGLIGDLTGRENIYLNAAILGISRKEITRKFDEIVAFAELEQFLDTPLKRYSSGMAVRLGFSIATSIDADILIVDEVLAVGDLAFQRKCFDRMEDMIKRRNKTVLLVSHNIRQVERLCERVMLLEAGRIVADGPAPQICSLFFTRSNEKILRNAEAVDRERTSEGTGQIELMNIQMLDGAGNPVTAVTYQSAVTVQLRYRTHVRLPNPIFFVGVHTVDFVYIATENTEHRLRLPPLSPGIHDVECRIPRFPLLPGVYAFRAAVGAGEVASIVLHVDNAFFFTVLPPLSMSPLQIQEGLVAFECDWLVDGRGGGDAVEPRIEMIGPTSSRGSSAPSSSADIRPVS